MNDEVRCGKARRLLVMFADGELEAGSQEAMEIHLESCSRCRAELEVLEGSLARLRSFSEGAPEGCPREAFVERLCRIPSGGRVLRGKMRLGFAAAAVAAAALAIVLAVYWKQVTGMRKPAPVTPALSSGGPSTRQFVSDEFFQARMTAVKVVMAGDVKLGERRPEVSTTYAVIFAEVPAIMLAAANQIDYEVGLAQEAAEKYQRIVKLFPESKQAKVAAQRLSELATGKKEGKI